MPGVRATFSRSAADRELHTHLGKAAQSVRIAIGVCGRASKARVDEDGAYRHKQKDLARAERMLHSIGHLDQLSDPPDMRNEARALCAWLTSRERSVGIRLPNRRGQEYQSRLQKVAAFLSDEKIPDEEPEEEITEPEVAVEQEPDGVLWNRALKIAKQQGEGDNDAYVMTIFKRLVGGATDG